MVNGPGNGTRKNYIIMKSSLPQEKIGYRTLSGIDKKGVLFEKEGIFKGRYMIQGGVLGSSANRTT